MPEQNEVLALQTLPENGGAAISPELVSDPITIGSNLSLDFDCGSIMTL